MKAKNILMAATLALAAVVNSVKVAAAKTLGAFGLAPALNIYSQYTYDASLLLKAAAAVSASADGSLILDMGSGLVEADMVIDVTALEINSNDESYEVILQGSPDATFGTAANITPLASLTIGDKASTRLALMALGTDDAIGRYVCPVRNERNGTTYRYLRISTIVTGTIASGGINYSAWLAKR